MLLDLSYILLIFGLLNLTIFIEWAYWLIKGEICQLIGKVSCSPYLNLMKDKWTNKMFCYKTVIYVFHWKAELSASPQFLAH